MKTKTILSIVCICTSIGMYAQSWTTGTSLLYTNPTTTKVGIGITNPTEMLHVNGGGLKIGNSTASADRSLNILKFGDGNYVNIGEWEADDMLSFKASRYNFANGNVGIGTASPAYKLDVNGTMRTTKLLITQPNAVTDWNTLWQSGFYDGANATNAPEPEYWFWGIHMGHGSNNSNYRYGGQIAIRNHPNVPAMFFRSVDVNGEGIWKELMTVGGNVPAYGSGEVGPALELINKSKSGSGIAKYWRIFNMTGSYGNSLQFWAYESESNGGNLGNKFTITDSGSVGIGTMQPGTKLDVIGVIRAHEVKVCLNQGCDFVFEPDYKLMPLNELDQFITTNRHLPEVAPAVQMEDEGINLSEMNAKLLQKVEELTLYIIDLNNRIETLENGNK